MGIQILATAPMARSTMEKRNCVFASGTSRRCRANTLRVCGHVAVGKRILMSIPLLLLLPARREHWCRRWWFFLHVRKLFAERWSAQERKLKEWWVLGE